MYSVIDAGSIEGRRKPISREFGARAIELSRFDSESGQEGFAHDERESGQEEIYAAVAGSGVIRVGAEKRQVVAGPEGLAYVVGAAVDTVSA